ncbi:hypothetical protein EVAR_38539_1 [Eumeta japonica]|uniref:Secreted protein n=1 Tax=Eumeta variegata TaxID=151549 RepID=A0A4C1WEG1_EUMVA|nr:hypothetical protein EVAR_38539_1 [Eumeta japonica]
MGAVMRFLLVVAMVPVCLGHLNVYLSSSEVWRLLVGARRSILRGDVRSLVAPSFCLFFFSADKKGPFAKFETCSAEIPDDELRAPATDLFRSAHQNNVTRRTFFIAAPLKTVDIAYRSLTRKIGRTVRADRRRFDRTTHKRPGVTAGRRPTADTRYLSNLRFMYTIDIKINISHMLMRRAGEPAGPSRRAIATNLFQVTFMEIPWSAAVADTRPVAPRPRRVGYWKLNRGSRPCAAAGDDFSIFSIAVLHLILTNIIKAKVCLDGCMDGCLFLFHAKTTEWISMTRYNNI